MNEQLLDGIVSSIVSNANGQAGPSRRIETSRFVLGRVFPRSFSEAREGAELYLMQSECVLQHLEDAVVDVRVRFKHPLMREVYKPAPQDYAPTPQDTDIRERPSYARVPELVVNGRHYRTRRGHAEREVRLASVWIQPGRAGWVRTSFNYPAMSDVQLLPGEDGGIAGAVVWRQEAINGTVEVILQPAWTVCTKIKVRISNETLVPHGADADMVTMRTLASTHIVLKAQHGHFHSLVHPGEYRDLVSSCENIGTWPVPVGDWGDRGCDTVVSLPALSGN